MGSSGSGSFSDYSGSSPKGGNGEGGGGASGEDRCGRAFACTLEEVEQCEHFAVNGSAPAVGSLLSIELRGRLLAIDGNGRSVGALPTRLNYLADCIVAGFTYFGRITASASVPIGTVSADFSPDRT
jgi:hypothetical protein